MQVKIITKTAGALALALCVICAAMFSGCGLNGAFRNYDPRKEYGFTADSSDVGVFTNPPAHIARIYSLRENTFVGSAIRYNITLHTPAQAQAGFREGMFFGFSRPGGAFVLDIIPGSAPIYLSAITEARVSFSFMPKAGQIYCVASGVDMGVFIGRPCFTLLEKSLCKKYLAEYFTKESMEQWQADKARFYKE
ncbi:hypothetical protein [Helicobacter sp.]|uniref:hypothetical protein n=1 Tax=Helicobacter sp. TaxID=218 RepID=UPI00388F9CB6